MARYSTTLLLLFVCPTTLLLLSVCLTASCSGDDDDGAGTGGGGGAADAAAATGGTGATGGAGGSDAGAATGGADAAPDGGAGGWQTVFPDPDWAVEEPQQRGLEPEVLQQVADWVESEGSNCFVVARHGAIVAEWYWNDSDRDSKWEAYSITKSFVSALIGIAQDRGELNIDDSASKYIEPWAGTDSEAVTVKNLISNDSGRYWEYDMDYVELLAAADSTGFGIELPGIDQPQQYNPGEHWEYNNAAIQTLERVLSEATGENLIDFAREHLLQKIGIDTDWLTDEIGNPRVHMGLQASCRDLARFGHLYMMQGTWAGGEQVVPEQWVRESLQPSTELNPAYGYLWWLNRPGDWISWSEADGRVTGSGNYFTDAPEDVFAAIGSFGQLIGVIPSEGIVLTRMGPNPNTDWLAFNALLINRTLSALQGADDPYVFEGAEAPDAGAGEVYDTLMPELSSAEQCGSFFADEIQPLNAELTEACAACACENCLQAINDCRTEAGCMDIMYCAFETGCRYMSCYAPDTCQSVIDGVPGGVVGAATTNASALTDCEQAQCEGDCPAAE